MGVKTFERKGQIAENTATDTVFKYLSAEEKLEVYQKHILSKKAIKNTFLG